jgi:hypothetical protein
MRRLALSLIAALLAVAFSWAVAESFYRWRFPPSFVGDPTLEPDPTLGWNSVPPLRELALNGDGGPAVIYMGDSFTQAALWPDEAQRLLREDALRTTGFNLGVSGYGTTQAMMKLRQHITAIAPRAVVLLFFAWNDLRDNYPYPEIYYGPQRTSRPYLLPSDRGWSPSSVRWASLVETALPRSEVYLRLFHRATLGLNALIVGRWPDLPARLGWRARLYYEQPASWQPFYRAADANTAYVQGAYATTREALRQIREITTHANASFVVIGIDNAFTVDADSAEDFLRPHPDLDPSLPMQLMARILREEGITFIDAQPELASLGRRLGRDVYSGPRGGLAGHLGPEGDQLIGQIAARWLTSELGVR